MNKSEATGPLVRSDNEPVFDEGWQAQVLALASNLIDRGQLDSKEWSQALGAELERAKQRGEADNSDTYYRSVLQALEDLLHTRKSLATSALDERTQAWRDAYLRTPHGHPVELLKE